MMHQELVDKKRWISERRFLHALNYCMLLPGPEAQQLATYLGWLMHRTWGGILAGTLFVLPSLLILILLSWIYLQFGNKPIIAALFFGIKPAVTAIVVVAVIRIAKRSIHHSILAWLAFFSFVAIFVFDLPFPLIIVGAALLGFWLGQRKPESLIMPISPIMLQKVDQTKKPSLTTALLHHRMHVLIVPNKSNKLVLGYCCG